MIRLRPGEGDSGGRDHGPSGFDVLRGGHGAPAEGDLGDRRGRRRSPVPGPGPAPTGLAGRGAAPGRGVDPAGRGPRSGFVGRRAVDLHPQPRLRPPHRHAPHPAAGRPARGHRRPGRRGRDRGLRLGLPTECRDSQPIGHRLVGRRPADDRSHRNTHGPGLERDRRKAGVAVRTGRRVCVRLPGRGDQGVRRHPPPGSRTDPLLLDHLRPDHLRPAGFHTAAIGAQDRGAGSGHGVEQCHDPVRQHLARRHRLRRDPGPGRRAADPGRDRIGRRPVRGVHARRRGATRTRRAPGRVPLPRWSRPTPSRRPTTACARPTDPGGGP